MTGRGTMSGRRSIGVARVKDDRLTRAPAASGVFGASLLLNEARVLFEGKFPSRKKLLAPPEKDYTKEPD
jgi:hypothetical protein